MEFYSAMQKNEILSFAGKWMEPENIILRLARLRSPLVFGGSQSSQMLAVAFFLHFSALHYCW
jgi:hypothetical protein